MKDDVKRHFQFAGIGALFGYEIDLLVIRPLALALFSFRACIRLLTGFGCVHLLVKLDSVTSEHRAGCAPGLATLSRWHVEESASRSEIVPVRFVS